MAITKERAVPVKLSLGTFQTLKSSDRVAKLGQMDSSKRDDVLRQLDPEAAAAFHGLLGITRKAAVVHAIVPPPTVAEAPPELEGPDEAPVPPKDPIFDMVRRILEAMQIDDFVQAYMLCKKVLGRTDVLNAVRALLVPTALNIARLVKHQRGDEVLKRGEPDALRAAVGEKLSDVISYAAYDEDTMASQDFNIIDQIKVNLPYEIHEPTIVEGITLVVLPDRGIPKQSGVRPLASGVYLIEATLVGVPTSIEADKRETLANDFALHELHASITPRSLQRPDSDAVWYPVFSQSFAAEIVQFPDQTKRYYGSTSANSEAQAAQLNLRLMRQRTMRREFEEQHAELYEARERARQLLSDRDIHARELSKAFGDFYGVSWNAKLSTITLTMRKDYDYDLGKLDDRLAERFRRTQEFNRKYARAAAQQAEIISLRIEVKAASKEIERLTIEIDALKAKLLNPYYALGDALQEAA